MYRSYLCVIRNRIIINDGLGTLLPLLGSTSLKQVAESRPNQRIERQLHYLSLDLIR